MTAKNKIRDNPCLQAGAQSASSRSAKQAGAFQYRKNMQTINIIKTEDNKTIFKFKKPIIMKNVILLLVAVLVIPVTLVAQNEEEKETSAIYFTVEATNIKRDSTSEVEKYGEGGYVKIDPENRVLNLSGEEKYFIKKDITEEEGNFDIAWTAELMNGDLEVVITFELKDEHTYITIFTPKSGHQITLKAAEVKA
jgi:hypothetical protein